MKTRLIAAFAAALLIFSFTACKSQQNTGVEPGTTKGIDYKNENAQQILTKIAKEQASVKEFTNITGTFTGLIDNNSLEIIVEKNSAIENSDGPMAFRIPDELKPYFDNSSKAYKDFRKDEKVVFSFYKNENGQLVLTKLEKAK